MTWDTLEQPIQRRLTANIGAIKNATQNSQRRKREHRQRNTD